MSAKIAYLKLKKRGSVLLFGLGIICAILLALTTTSFVTVYIALVVSVVSLLTWNDACFRLFYAESRAACEARVTELQANLAARAT